MHILYRMASKQYCPQRLHRASWFPQRSQLVHPRTFSPANKTSGKSQECYLSFSGQTNSAVHDLPEFVGVRAAFVGVLIFEWVHGSKRVHLRWHRDSLRRVTRRTHQSGSSCNWICFISGICAIVERLSHLGILYIVDCQMKVPLQQHSESERMCFLCPEVIKPWPLHTLAIRLSTALTTARSSTSSLCNL